MSDIFKIDESKLDREWVIQPQLQRQVGEEEADAQHVLNQKKAEFDVICARLSLAIRSDPEKYGIGKKPTIGEVDHALTLERDYQAGLTQLNLAKYQLDVAGAKKTAMIDRRKALENLVQLLSLNYYSEREPRTKSYDGPRRMSDAERHEVRGDGVDVDLG